MHSVDFLLIIPECFQVVLINLFLLFAICFSYYKTQSSKTAERNTSVLRPFEKVNTQFSYKTSVQLKNTTENQEYYNNNTAPVPLFFADKLTQKQPVNIKNADLPTPVILIEPVVQLVVLALICCSILYINSPLTYAIGLTDSIIWDNLGCFMSILLCASASASLVLGLAGIKRYGRYEFIFIIWLSIIGMLCLLKSYNFLTLYLSIELQSLSFYMLAAMRSKTESSAEAGLKYFILSAFSSAILLLGITLIYAAIGSQNFADLSIIVNYFSEYSNAKTGMATVLSSPISLTIGLGCVCVSLLFKLAAAPFHLWVADVYEGSPTSITAFFAITAKIAAATALIRILELQVITFKLLPFVAILSLIIGSFSAMRQVKLKRLIAFSGVANVGWFLLALVTGQWDLLIIHLIVYILLSVCLFSIFVLPLFRTHPNLEYRQRIYTQNSSDHSIDHGTDSLTIKYISDLNQLNKTNPSLAFAMNVAFFSLAGIPPFAGFYSKYLIINALTQTEQYLTLFIALGSAVLSAFYYIRVIKTIYFTNAGVFFSFNPNLFKINFSKSITQLSVSLSKKSKASYPKNGLYFAPLGKADYRKKQLIVKHDHNNAHIDSTQSSAEKLKMFTIMPISSNAYICALSTILTIIFFIKPDYIFVCIALSQ